VSETKEKELHDAGKLIFNKLPMLEMGKFSLCESQSTPKIEDAGVGRRRIFFRPSLTLQTPSLPTRRRHFGAPRRHGRRTYVVPCRVVLSLVVLQLCVFLTCLITVPRRPRT
jgi:hypothetical protein